MFGLYLIFSGQTIVSAYVTYFQITVLKSVHYLFNRLFSKFLLMISFPEGNSSENLISFSFLDEIANSGRLKCVN